MLLAVDIGNSNIVFGVYNSEKNLFHTRICTDKEKEFSQYAVLFDSLLKLYGVQNDCINTVIISSVVPRLTGVIAQAAHLLFACPIREFNRKLCPDFTIAIDNPDELGSDLLASAYYVRHTMPCPAIVIDAGTATKISAIGANGEFLGVSIAPGMFISLNAMVKSTSLLIETPVEAPPHAIGTNTAHSIKSGVLLGTSAMLDGMVNAFKEEMGGSVQTIIGTGGAAPYIFPLMKNEIVLAPTLILDGIALSAENL